jgi:hypothetical protein
MSPSCQCRTRARIRTRSSPGTGRQRAPRGSSRWTAPSRGAVWLARHQLARCPPVTFEAAARLRALSAESARVAPASARPGYAALLGEALGLSIEALMEDWGRHAAETRTRAVREHLRRWVSEWAGRLDRGNLGDHLDEAARVLAAARADLSGLEKRDAGLAAPRG